RDVVKNLRQLALEAGEVGAASGQLCERLHLVIRLQVVHVADWYHPAGAAMMHLAILAGRETNADGIDRDVLGGLDLLEGLVQGKLAEGVDSRGHKNDVFLAFDTINSVQGIEQRVKQVGFGETRHA